MTDIAALAKWMRSYAISCDEDEEDEVAARFREAADALEACQAERDEWRNELIEAGEVTLIQAKTIKIWEARAEKAEAEVERLRALVDPLDQWFKETRP